MRYYPVQEFPPGCRIEARRSGNHHAMISRRKIQISLLAFTAYGFIALLAQIIYRVKFGHGASSWFSSFAFWSGIASGFCLLFGGLIQAFRGFRRSAVFHAALGIVFVLGSAYLLPYLART